MKKILAILLCSFIFVGCNTNAQSNNDGQEKQGLIIGGSTSIQPLMEHLAESYNTKDQGSISIQGGGSSVGSKGTMDGTFQVGMVSRDLKADELESLDATIAIDGIVIIIHKDNPIKDIILEDAKKIFTGEITNWSKLGGVDSEIAVVSREEGSGTRDGFETIIGFKSEELIKNASVQNATGAVISSVSGNKNAIGYISLGSLTSQVNALQVEGIEANEATIVDGSYKLQRPFILCVQKDNEVAKAFYDFIFSSEGKKIIQENKYIPVEQ